MLFCQNKGLPQFWSPQMGAILAPNRTGGPGDVMGWGGRRVWFSNFIWRKNICARKMGL